MADKVQLFVPIPNLETLRLILRPIRLDDARRAQQLFPHWEIVQYMSAHIPWPFPDNGAEDHYKTSALPANETGEKYTWALTLKSENDDQLIGIISLMPKDESDNRGFWIGLPYQKMGLMKEAVYAVNNFAFEVLNMPHLILNDAEPNGGSHRLKEISGAEIIAVIPDTAYIAGQRFPQVRWKLTREAWLTNRHKFLPPLAESEARAQTRPQEP